jgi:hypothetical protein
MSLLTVYRVDKRDFLAGATIKSANQFQALNPNGSRRVEHIFECRRPESKPKRIGSLFLFEDLIVARKHWSKMKDGKLYEIQIEGSSIQHRGDMRLVDEALACDDQSCMESCANRYWSGIETTSPRIELLVTSASVSKLISADQAERRSYLLNWPPA